MSAGCSFLPTPWLKLPKIFVFFQQIRIQHVFHVPNAKQKDIGHFLMSSKNKLFFIERRTYYSQRRGRVVDGNPKLRLIGFRCIALFILPVLIKLNLYPVYKQSRPIDIEIFFQC